LIVLVALLIAAPALADRVVTVSCVPEGGSPLVVAINYSFTATAGEPNRIRAFAVKVSVPYDCNIVDVTDYAEGESSQYSGRGYGIFPGDIDLTDPEVPIWGKPIAPEEDRGAEGTGLGKSAVILELGSLYAGGDPNAPPSLGTLCKLHVTGTGTGRQMTIEEEIDVRGGIVLENPPGDAPDQVILTGCLLDLAEPTCWDATECAGQPDGDGTCNGSINLGDLVALKAAWGQSGPPWVPPHCCSDYNHSGSVNLGDLVILKSNWGNSGYLPSTNNQNCP
jgi:hypothetical protein